LAGKQQGGTHSYKKKGLGVKGKDEKKKAGGKNPRRTCARGSAGEALRGKAAGVKKKKIRGEQIGGKDAHLCQKKRGKAPRRQFKRALKRSGCLASKEGTTKRRLLRKNWEAIKAKSAGETLSIPNGG